MKLVDSCCWIDHFIGQSSVGNISAAISDTENLIVPTICLFEVYRKILGEKGKLEALRAVASMRTGNVIPLDAELAVQAASISKEHRIPMADSIIYATAKQARALLLSRDPHFKGLSGVKYIA